MTRKIFIDLGTHKFEGLYEFIEKLNIDKSWDVICAEPQKHIFEKGSKLIPEFSERFNKFEYLNKAVLDYNGTVTFNYHKGWWTDSTRESYDPNGDVGSNCLIENPKRDVNGVIFDIYQEDIECIDIEDILNKIADDNKNNDYEIFMKCDIEGSEFKVLPKLLKSDHVNKFKNVYIEWHERFFSESDNYRDILRQKEKIISELRRKKINHFYHY